MSRIVVVLFGPSGAGKTTIARASGLKLFDRDDEPWKHLGEKAFGRAIRRLAIDEFAQAVVIRAGATSKARAASIRSLGATHAFLVEAPQHVCHSRAYARGRWDERRSHHFIDDWFARHDRHDRIALWPGSWDEALAHPIVLPPFMPKRVDTRNKAGDPRGTQAWARLRAQVYAEETHCWRCGRWVDQTLPRNHRMSRTADHLDQVARGGAGIPDRSRVRLAHWGCNSARGARVDPELRGLTVQLSSI